MPDRTASQIHEAALALLMDPGIRIGHDDIRELLIRQGARQGLAGGVVRIHSHGQLTGRRGPA